MAIWKATFSLGGAVFGDGCRPYFTHTPDPKKQSWKPTQTGIIYKHAVRQIPTLFSGGAGVGVRKLWPTPVNEGRTKQALLLSFAHIIGSKNAIFATFCPYFTALLRFHFCASCSFFFACSSALLYLERLLPFVIFFLHFFLARNLVYRRHCATRRYALHFSIR